MRTKEPFLDTLFNNFILSFEQNENVLGEKGMPTPYVLGWHCWNPWNGKVDEKTYNIKLSRRWEVYDSDAKDKLARAITSSIIKLAKVHGIIVKIKKAHVFMCNPDRCVYEGTLSYLGENIN